MTKRAAAGTAGVLVLGGFLAAQGMSSTDSYRVR
jgi:hypothetical protein